MDTQETETITDVSDAVQHEAEKDVQGIYEVGYHIISTISEDGLEAEVNKITEALKSISTDFVGERFPAKVQLSYSIEKKVDGERRNFSEAYFGWVAFEAKGGDLPKLDEALKAHENVLRHIIIKTSRDAVAATMADPGLDVGSPQPETEDEEGVSEDALDEALENIEGKEAA